MNREHLRWHINYYTLFNGEITFFFFHIFNHIIFLCAHRSAVKMKMKHKLMRKCVEDNEK